MKLSRVQPQTKDEKQKNLWEDNEVDSQEVILCDYKRQNLVLLLVMKIIDLNKKLVRIEIELFVISLLIIKKS